MASGVAAPDTAADNQYFYEDEVFRIDKQGRVKFGLVLENEAYSTDEEADYHYDDILLKGEIRIAWHPDGKEDILYEKLVGLADRTLMPGDVVRRLVPGKDTQRGYCREINMRADLKIVGSKYVIKNVMAERLRPLVKYNRDNAVCLDSWVGSTKCVNEKIILKSSCGAILEVPDVDLGPLKDRNTKFRNGLFADTVFYPGQTVKGRLDTLENVKLLTPSINLKTNKKGKLLDRKFVVQSIQIEGVWVHWQCKALSEDGSDLKANMLQQPKPYVTGDDLKRLKYLNLFESCMLQINDKNYLQITDCDVVIKKSQWEKEQAIKYKLLLNQQQKDENNQSNVTSKNTRVSKNVGDKIKVKLTHSNLLDVENRKHLLLKTSKLNNSTTVLKNTVTGGVVVSAENNTSTAIETNIDTVISENSDKNSKSDVIDKTVSCTDDNNKLKPNIEVNPSSDGWLTDEDCDDNDDFEDNSISESTTTTISTCSSPTPKSSPKCSPLLHKKQIKKFKKTIANNATDKIPAVGDQVVTEALVVYSTATVVWQDGTVESGIASTQLYPIHHLDDHEFFPGDFVLSGVEGADVSFRDYGVIQTVDHQGRTAHVKWFTTYTSADEPKPTFIGESEVSVYDLKDHPDFQYRPGTIVIRVANFVGEDSTCTAGQIIDNYVDGHVKVWWVDGHISMCWPQDLFEVGQYDADNNFWGNNDSDNDSWETESENSEPGGTPQKDSDISAPHLAINLERARVAMSRLEEIFSINPTLQNQEVMRKLLAVYKKCRYLDRLMNTSFFHEDHFMGLLERVRKGSSQSKAERAQDQKNRLFNQSSSSSNSEQQQQQPSNPVDMVTSIFDNNITVTNHDSGPIIVSSSREYSPKVILNLSSTPFKYSSIKKKPNTKLEINTQQNNFLDGTATTNNITIKQVDHQKQVDHTTSNHLFNNKCSSISNNVFNSNQEMLTTTTTTMSSNNLSCGGNNYVNSVSCGCGGSAAVVVNANKLVGQQQQQQSILYFENCNKTFNSTTTASDPKNLYSNEKNKLLLSVMSHIEKATQETEKSNQLKLYNTTLTTTTSLLSSGGNGNSGVGVGGGAGSTSQDDSGNFSRTNDFCDGSSTSYASSNDLTADVNNISLLKANDDQKSISCSSIELTDDSSPEFVCARLCTLLKGQLVKALQEIQQKYCKNILNLSDVVEYSNEIINDDDHHDANDGNEHDRNLMNVICNEENITEINETLIENELNGDNSDLNISKSPLLSDVLDESPTSNDAVSSDILNSVQVKDGTSLCFQVMETAPSSHKFHLTIFHPANAQQYYRAVSKEHKLLRSSLPPGVWVRVFEDRMDLISVMIEGPKNTPYEDGMFFFDIQLGRDYPKTPPLCHYVSFCSDRLNPNLYEDGKVCVSLLGTWSGRDSEIWGPNSTLLQVIVSIQGLILVPEPYFNEAGYEKQKGTQQGTENSRMYNEMVVIKLVQSMTKLISSPPIVFREQILKHFRNRGHLMHTRIKNWMELSQQHMPTTNSKSTDTDMNIIKSPDFPLVPASRGFCLTLAGLLDNFYRKVESIDLTTTTVINIDENIIE